MSNGVLTEKRIADFYRNKKILLIGGTGTIGECMVKLLLGFSPSVIRVFSRDEYKQYILANKYEGEKRLRYLLGDVRDYARIEKAAQDIDIIFNLAALKHVPACEYNPFEAVKTNVIGTQNVINAAIENSVKNVVFTSSDKAIGPTNAMGATKLLGERLMIAADNMKGAADISFSAVRFGNVLGSRGSVVPFFVDQIINSGKVTVTDAKMTRFMMSISEAVLLTARAAAIAVGGEIFVLKMPNIKIMDLVECVIELTCKKNRLNAGSINIKQIGMRPGEKLYEELMTDFEAENALEFPDMYAIVPLKHYGSENYKNLPKVVTANYTSNNVPCISKEQVMNMLISENII